MHLTALYSFPSLIKAYLLETLHPKLHEVRCCLQQSTDHMLENKRAQQREKERKREIKWEREWGKRNPIQQNRFYLSVFLSICLYVKSPYQFHAVLFGSTVRFSDKRSVIWSVALICVPFGTVLNYKDWRILPLRFNLRQISSLGLSGFVFAVFGRFIYLFHSKQKQLNLKG